MALRAPELIFGEKIDSSIDIWCFGCLVYEFLTGTALFCVSKLADDEDEEADDDHLLELNDILEPLPDSWLLEKWPRAHKYFGPNRERLSPEMDIESLEGEIFGDEAGKDFNDEADNDINDEPDENATDRVEGGLRGEHEEQETGPWINSPLETLFAENKPADIDNAEAGVITSLIRSILKYNPSKRPSAIELLQHPWFKD